ncbi:spermidine synthase [Aquimarina algicola]|uniref:spermidine synthase n=1 Tax=Aquimarina algicola TaxID=2589995 RepID=UPI001CF266C5|nr:fused MFS/spermidine synthase [Aquimarina algicola]
MQKKIISKIISYVWPITKEIKSTINGTLEVTWMNGKKVLDSQNANYSYGTLQKLLHYGLTKINISSTSDILLLGLGGGSVISSLRNTFEHKGKITALEIDQVVIDIAIDEFKIKNLNNLEIICEDALSYIHNCNKKFDLIIVDIFIDNKVPEPFYTHTFWKQTLSLVNKEGYVIFNAGINLKNNTKVDTLISTFKTQITFDQYNKVQGANTLLIGKIL